MVTTQYRIDGNPTYKMVIWIDLGEAYYCCTNMSYTYGFFLHAQYTWMHLLWANIPFLVPRDFDFRVAKLFENEASCVANWYQRRGWFLKPRAVDHAKHHVALLVATIGSSQKIIIPCPQYEATVRKSGL